MAGQTVYRAIYDKTMSFPAKHCTYLRARMHAAVVGGAFAQAPAKHAPTGTPHGRRVFMRLVWRCECQRLLRGSRAPGLQPWPMTWSRVCARLEGAWHVQGGGTAWPAVFVTLSQGLCLHKYPRIHASRAEARDTRIIHGSLRLAGADPLPPNARLARPRPHP